MSKDNGTPGPLATLPEFEKLDHSIYIRCTEKEKKRWNGVFGPSKVSKSVRAIVNRFLNEQITRMDNAK